MQCETQAVDKNTYNLFSIFISKSRKEKSTKQKQT